MRRSLVCITIPLILHLMAACGSVEILAAEASLQTVLPPGGCSGEWPLEDRVSLFSRDTLFDHINGEAELYLPYGFDALATAVYTKKGGPDASIVADVYRMGSLLDAFGIYSNYRKADAVKVEIGAEGFASPTQLMFYQDRYFVRIQATGATGREQEIFLDCARKISQNLPQNRARPGELDLLGIQETVPGTERYAAKSLLGYAFFRRGMTADAVADGSRVQLFVVLEDSKDAARKAFDAYHAHVRSSGKSVLASVAPGGASISAVDPLYGGVHLEQQGRFVFGVIRIKDARTAKRLVDQLRGRLTGRSFFGGTGP